MRACVFPTDRDTNDEAIKLRTCEAQNARDACWSGGSRCTCLVEHMRVPSASCPLWIFVANTHAVPTSKLMFALYNMTDWLTRSDRVRCDFQHVFMRPIIFTIHHTRSDATTRTIAMLSHWIWMPSDWYACTCARACCMPFSVGCARTSMCANSHISERRAWFGSIRNQIAL